MEGPQFCPTRVAVVTGAGRGLGRQYALDLAAPGASVVINARREEVTGEGVAEIEAEGGHLARQVVEVVAAGDAEFVVDALEAVTHCANR